MGSIFSRATLVCLHIQTKIPEDKFGPQGFIKMGLGTKLMNIKGDVETTVLTSLDDKAIDVNRSGISCPARFNSFTRPVEYLMPLFFSVTNTWDTTFAGVFEFC